MLNIHFKPESSEFLADLARQNGFDIHCDQLDSGRFEGEIDFAQTANVQSATDTFAENGY